MSALGWGAGKGSRDLSVSLVSLVKLAGFTGETGMLAVLPSALTDRAPEREVLWPHLECHGDVILSAHATNL